MDFLKKHYEKILLGVVLLGLVGALVFLPFLIAKDQQAVEDMKVIVMRPKVLPLPPLDMTPESNAIAVVRAPFVLDFATTNRLFNPLQWQRKANGTWVPVRPGTIGPEAVVVTRITPLYTILALESVDTNSLATNAQGARYVISVEHQAAASSGQRIKRPHYASMKEKVDIFQIVGVKGTLDDPAHLQLVLQLLDTGEEVTISRGHPFRRIDGYSADLKYEPEGKRWQGQRVGADLKFNYDDYFIIAIDQNSVVLLARSNQKKTIRPYSPQNAE